MSGQLGYITPIERRSFNIQLMKTGDTSTLRLTTFLGQTVMKIKITPERSVLNAYNGEHYEADNPNVLIKQLTGLDIPLKELENWLLGLPNRTDHYVLNKNHMLSNVNSNMAKSPWSVTYRIYQNIHYQNGIIPLPYKLSLTHSTTKLNLIISKWKIEP